MDLKFLPLIGSEVALSLYPQLIKLIPTTIEVQVAVRCITYSILAIIGYCITQNTQNTQSKTTITSSTNSLTFTSVLIMGIVTIIHIISSYMCFNILSSGVGYSIFYMYPIFNLIGRTLIYNEKIDIVNYIYIIIAIIGVYLIYKNKNKPDTSLEPLQNQNENQNLPDNLNQILNIKNKNIGISAGIISALTESIIYFMVKANPVSVSPFIQLLKTYLFGGILSIIYLIKNLNSIDLDYHYWITIILFNAIIGFVGYLLRFIMIPRLSTLLFNSIIFVGVIFSYLWGYFLSKEPITYSDLSGTALILISIVLINK
jgi:drug/metabolite transporter (DMT)-like permease